MLIKWLEKQTSAEGAQTFSSCWRHRHSHRPCDCTPLVVSASASTEEQTHTQTDEEAVCTELERGKNSHLLKDFRGSFPPPHHAPEFL
jgi:hypothetical protein